MDPRAKLCAALGLSVVVAVCRSPATAAAALLLGLFLIQLADLIGRPLMRRMAVVNGFVAFLWLFLPFGTPGAPVFSLGPLTATRAGLDACILLTLKANAIMLVFIALAATSDAAALGQAMQRLGVPAKLVFLFLFTYRFIHVIADEYARLRTAARLRGFRPRTSAHTYRTLASLLAMVLLGAMRRAEMARRAMLLRCFNGRFATVRVFVLDRRAGLFLLGMGASLTILLVLELSNV